MPIATGLDREPTFVQLQSAPPDGYVKIRRMTHGERMERKGFMSKTKIAVGGENRAARRQANKDQFMAEMDLATSDVTLFEFAHCIVEHNLTYLVDPKDPSTETPLDFRNPAHVRMLDGNIGEEIDEAITRVNDFEAEDDTGK